MSLRSANEHESHARVGRFCSAEYFSSLLSVSASAQLLVVLSAEENDDDDDHMCHHEMTVA